MVYVTLGNIQQGKEDILEALSALCTSCHTAISAADPAIENDILSVVTSACNKKVNKFRDAAFRCLDKVLKSFKNPDFFGVVFPLLFEMCNGAFISKQGSSSLNETRETEDTSVPHDKIIECITSCVILARLNDIIKWQKDLVHVYLNSLAPAISWIVKVSVFTSIKELCSRISEGLKDMDQGVDVSSLVIEVTEFHCQPSLTKFVSLIVSWFFACSCFIPCLDKVMDAFKRLQSRNVTFGGPLRFLLQILTSTLVMRTWPR
ncbi:putative proteasome component Ecm29 [Helianthus anomalus]